MLNTIADPGLLWPAEGLAGVLVTATAAGAVLRRKAVTMAARATVVNLNARIRTWWGICAIVVLALACGRTGAAVLFGVASFLALRELLSLAPLARADHRALLFCFFVAIPVQYLLVATGQLGLAALFIPAITLVALPLLGALQGDCTRFLQRAATLQWGLLVCVYGVSFAPALLSLRLHGHTQANVRLLVFFLLVVQASDVLQYVWGKWLGRRPIAPRVSPNKTWEGFIGGILSATALGAALWWETPFRPWQAAVLALAVALAGFAGGLTLSAIKRDRGVKDFGTLIAGHGGVLDRIDSICFAAPVFFLLVNRFLV